MRRLKPLSQKRLPGHRSRVLKTGNQLRAARALVGMDQSVLARKAKVNVNTIRSMEACGTGLLTSGLDTVQKVMKPLEAAGVEFIEKGVRLR